MNEMMNMMDKKEFRGLQTPVCRVLIESWRVSRT
jgi:hypothetical protein